jgi:hypothetical protein
MIQLYYGYNSRDTYGCGIFKFDHNAFALSSGGMNPIGTSPNESALKTTIGINVLTIDTNDLLINGIVMDHIDNTLASSNGQFMNFIGGPNDYAGYIASLNDSLAYFCHSNTANSAIGDTIKVDIIKYANGVLSHYNFISKFIPYGYVVTSCTISPDLKTVVFTLYDNGVFTLSNWFNANIQIDAIYHLLILRDTTGMSTSIVEMNNTYNSNLNVYPNPTSDIINISFKSISKTTSVELFSITGQLILSNKIESFIGEENNIIVDLSIFENGIYFIKVNNKTMKIIKE